MPTAVDRGRVPGGRAPGHAPGRMPNGRPIACLRPPVGCRRRTSPPSSPPTPPPARPRIVLRRRERGEGAPAPRSSRPPPPSLRIHRHPTAPPPTTFGSCCWPHGPAAWRTPPRTVARPSPSPSPQGVAGVPLSHPTALSAPAVPPLCPSKEAAGSPFRGRRGGGNDHHSPPMIGVPGGARCGGRANGGRWRGAPGRQPPCQMTGAPTLGRSTPPPSPTPATPPVFDIVHTAKYSRRHSRGEAGGAPPRGGARLCQPVPIRPLPPHFAGRPRRVTPLMNTDPGAMLAFQSISGPPLVLRKSSTTSLVREVCRQLCTTSKPKHIYIGQHIGQHYDEATMEPMGHRYIEANGNYFVFCIWNQATNLISTDSRHFAQPSQS